MSRKKIIRKSGHIYPDFGMNLSQFRDSYFPISGHSFPIFGMLFSDNRIRPISTLGKLIPWMGKIRPKMFPLFGTDHPMGHSYKHKKSSTTFLIVREDFWILLYTYFLIIGWIFGFFFRFQDLINTLCLPCVKTFKSLKEGSRWYLTCFLHCTLSCMVRLTLFWA